MATTSRPNYSNTCSQYLRLSDCFTIDQAAALWCSGDPGEDPKLLRATATCFTIKHDLILQAVMSRRLPVTYGVGGPKIDVSRSHTEPDRLRITRADLVAWFEGLPIDDRPAFLFDDDHGDELPDVSEVAEMTADRAIAIMAFLLADGRPAMSISERPNAAAIGAAVADRARIVFGQDVRGFESFHKRLSRAVKTLQADSDGGFQLWRKQK